MPLHGEQRVGHSQNVGFCQKQRLFILDILVFVSLQNVFLISGSHTPSGVIGWSWEMVPARKFLLWSNFLSFVTVSHSNQFLWKK